MSSRRAEGSLALLVAIASLGCAAFAAGQTAQIINVQGGTAYAVSDDGNIVVGTAPRGDTNSDQGYRWQNNTSVYVGSLNTFFKGSHGQGLSANGNVVVGHTQKNGLDKKAFRWIPGGPQGGQMVSLVPISLDAGESVAYDVSDDGAIIVGRLDMPRNGVLTARAVRWNGSSPVDLNPTAPLTDKSGAYGISADGSVIVGTFREESTDRHAFRWTSTTGLVDLGTSDGQFGVSHANAVSADGTVVGGYTGQNTNSGQASLWKDGSWTLLDDLGSIFESEVYDVSHDGRVAVGVCGFDAMIWDETGAHKLRDYLIAYRADMTGWSGLDVAYGCSKDGRVIVGKGSSGSFRAYLPLPNRAPTVTSNEIPPGGTINVKLGQTFQTTFKGRDSDLDTLTMNENFTIGTFSPSNNNSGPSPFDVNFTFTPVVSDVGSHSGTVKFTDTSGDLATNSGQLDFTIVVPPNNIPTVAPIAAKTIECNGKHNLVTLVAPVADADGHPLKVDWFVNGLRKQTTSNVSSGNTQFKYDFPHGVSDVVVQVSDAYSAPQQQATTVTVQDTTAPVVIVAPTLVVPTDPGVAYATKPRLPKPQVNEKCDGDPELTNDAPPVMPIGTYTVTWTAKDFTGLTTSATQQIVVKDLEAPEMLVTAAVNKRVDRGEVYATIKLPQPQVFDNVSAAGKIVVKSNARPRYPIGTTTVTWTATDEAGNLGRATTKVTVVNRRPTANAGADIVVNTTSESGARVRLNGGKSSDPDGHALKYLWSARGVKFSPKTSKTPLATFKVGVTNVKLTVTDEGGAKHTDTVRVTVRLKGGSARSQGAAANEAFATASSSAARSVASGETSDASVAGYRYSAAADRFGLAAGEYVRWDEGQSEADGLASYAELRYYQALYGEQATNELIRAFAETGDDSTLHALLEAARGVQAAHADLAE